MTKIKDLVLRSLEEEPKTIQQLCMEFDVDDDLKMSAVVAELEIERKVCLKSMKQFWDNTDGDLRPGYLGVYGCIG